MRRTVISVGAIVSLLILLVLPASVGADESLTGPIKELRTQGLPKERTPAVVAYIRLEGYDVGITKETTIVFSDARKATAADLKVGQRVSALMSEKIYSTDPLLFYTDVIVIQVSAKPDRKDKR